MMCLREDYFFKSAAVLLQNVLNLNAKMHSCYLIINNCEEL